MSKPTPDDLIINKRKTPPYWWPDANVLMQMFLAGAIVVMVGYILMVLLEQKVQLEQTQRDLLMILFGIILGCFKDVYGYTFGSSAGQKRQGEVITQSLQDKDKIIADNVVTTAAMHAGTGPGGAMSDALKAASAVAPLAAAVAAPPAAAVAAPPAAEAAAPAAAEKAVAEALANQPKETP